VFFWCGWVRGWGGYACVARGHKSGAHPTGWWLCWLGGGRWLERRGGRGGGAARGWGMWWWGVRPAWGRGAHPTGVFLGSGRWVVFVFGGWVRFFCPRGWCEIGAREGGMWWWRVGRA